MEPCEPGQAGNRAALSIVFPGVRGDSFPSPVSFSKIFEMALSAEQLIALLFAVTALFVAGIPSPVFNRVFTFVTWTLGMALLLNGSELSTVAASILAIVLFVMAFDWSLRWNAPARGASSTLWLGAASCAIAVTATSNFLLLIAVAFLGLQVLAMRIEQGNELIVRHDALPISLISLTLGLSILGMAGSDGSAQQLASILVVCGIGGLLDWFPFPRVHPHSQNLVDVIPCRLLPVIAASSFFWKLVSLNQMSESNLAWLAIAGLFSLLFSALKMMGETSLSRRISIAPLTILSHSLIASLLLGWIQLNPQRNWIATSNFPSVATLFVVILTCETLGCLGLITGCCLIAPHANHDLSDDLLSGVIRQKPWVGTVMLTSLLSLAGLAPAAGFWWRFLVTSALLLPHRQSTLNGLTEAHAGLTTFAIALVSIWLLLAVSHIILIGRVLLEIPFRVRDVSAPVSIHIAASILMLCLLALSVMPLRIAEQLPVAIW